MKPLIAPAPAANLIWLSEADSTNAVVARVMAAWMEAGEEEQLADTVVIARRQNAGQGRGTNSWVSPPGGLYATWFGWLPTGSLGALPAAAGVVLAEAVARLVPGTPVRLKWPNDLQVDGRKLAGILCQSRVAGEEAWAMVGFGVNVDVEPVLASDDPVRPVTLASLGWEEGSETATARLVAAFVVGIRKAVGEPAATLSTWQRLSIHTRGEAMTVRLPDGELRGAFAGFGENGVLRLDVGGRVVEVAAGELVPGGG